MFAGPPKEKEWLSWLYVALWTLVVYATIPFARLLQGYIRDNFGKELFSSIVLFGVVLGIGLMLFYVVRLRATRSWSNALWLVGVGAALAAYTYRLRANPEEALHFLEYGLLGLLIYRAYVHRVRDWTIYFATILVGAMLGTVDEIIQWVTPERYWGWRDVWFNTVACALMQVAIAKGIRPSVISLKVTPASIRRLARLGIAFLVLCGFCFSNRLDRVEWVAERVPALGFLHNNKSVMAEYGYRHDDPGIGSFFSRMTLDELAHADRERGVEAARILDEYHDPRKYGDFLAVYTPSVDAFTHEARVHLYRRDHYLHVLPQHAENGKEYRDHATVALRENQLVEKYFTNTLNHTRHYRWRRERVDELAPHLDADLNYVSPVSRHLINRFTEGQIWALLLAGIAALVIVDRTLGRKRRSHGA